MHPQNNSVQLRLECLKLAHKNGYKNHRKNLAIAREYLRFVLEPEKQMSVLFAIFVKSNSKQAIMDKELKDAIMALPQMKERIKRIHAYAGEKYQALPENITVSVRITTKTVANGKEDEISIDINNKLRELISKPLK